MLGTEFRFVRCKPEDMFGIVELWPTKTERVRVNVEPDELRAPVGT